MKTHSPQLLRPLTLAAILATALQPMPVVGQPSTTPPEPMPVIPQQPLPPPTTPPAPPRPQPVVPLPMGPPPPNPGPNTSAGGLYTQRHSISVALNSPVVVRNLTNTRASGRNPVLTQVEANIKASSLAMTNLKGAANALRSEDRNRFDAAYLETQTREKALNASLALARQSTDTDWLNTANRLANDYQAYAQAVAEAETLSQPATSP